MSLIGEKTQLHNPFKGFSRIDPDNEYSFRQIEKSVFEHLIQAGLPGPEYQVIFFIIEKTKGYQKQEDMISLSQFEDATYLDRRYIFRIINSLENRHMIIVDRTKRGGRGHSNTYMFNRHWDTWLTPNDLKIAERNSDKESPFPETVTGNHPSASNSDSKSLIGKGDNESLFSGINSDKSAINSDSHAQRKSDYQSPTIDNTIDITTKDNKGGSSPQGYGAETPASKYLFEKTGRKRWHNLEQKEQFEAVEAEVGEDRMKEAIKWALTSGISNIKSIITAARRNKRGETGQQRRESARAGPVRSDAHRGSDKAPTREEYLRSIEK